MDRLNLAALLHKELIGDSCSMSTLASLSNGGIEPSRTSQTL
ncbi:hypothetical protein RRU94_18585 [Domibacillus sp. DTU_2020_1001157_1_SI_ALB_TIR_016]|nr:hypothetical protein [Domibacillus sp. DTU_2020_1001157_1_SI_ALB_TIR_016]WNS79536.1 hypothetical protein RRU94_18585 [Domibacillus sp. DTU_2020_1001157_1_SI_ALB_TIR_016]